MTSFTSQWADYLPTLLDGLKLSVGITAASLRFGIPLGLMLALATASPSKVPRAVAIAFVEVGRGAPALVVLQLVYFGLPGVGLSMGSITAACVALALTTGAYTSEILRAGLQSVAAGQREASEALGMNKLDELRFVILPQGLRVALPALVGFAIIIFQTTSLTFTIAVPELLSRAYSIGSSTFDYLSVLVLAGLLYAAISIPATWLTVGIERRLSRHL